MTALPSIASFTAPTVTEGEFKTALSNLHLFLSGLLGTTGAAADAQAALGALLGAGVTTKTGAYTVAAADRGRVIACSGTFTVTLPDAGAVDAGFAVAIANYGTGTVTVDPFSTQTLDGASTRTLAASRMMVVCAVNGKWLSVGGIGAASTTEAGVVQLSTSTSSTSTTLAATSSAVKAAYDLAAAATTTADAKLKTGATAGTHYQFVNSGTTEATAATKIIEARCLVGGTLRTHMTVTTSHASRTAYAQIYKNGVAVGSLRSTTSTAGEVFTEDIAFSLGDLIQVYGYVNNAVDSPICTVFLRLGAASSSYGLLAVST
jgi:hypothetical protein